MDTVGNDDAINVQLGDAADSAAIRASLPIFADAIGRKTQTGVADALSKYTTRVNAAIANLQQGSNNGHLFKPVNTEIADGEERVFNVPIIAGLFNIDKYFPLLFINNGIELIFHLEDTVNIGVYAGAVNGDYTIKDVKYVAHEINLDNSYVSQMKASMAATGGILSLSSTTFKYNQVRESALDANGGDFPITVRAHSLKGLLVRPQVDVLDNNKDRFSLGTGQQVGIEELQFRIGSMLYPSEPLQFNNKNKGELFNEIRKCFGTIHGYNYGTRLNNVTFRESATVDSTTGNLTTGSENFAAASTAPTMLQYSRGKVMAGQLANQKAADSYSVAGTGSGSVRQHWLMAFDFETFAKQNLETGLNLTDKSMPVGMYIKRSPQTPDNTVTTGVTSQSGIRYDCFGMCDLVLYIQDNGEIFSRV
eukprot:COSAG06_NODE_2243_length_7267_cov_3.942662_3_plen_421_part_00